MQCMASLKLFLQRAIFRISSNQIGVDNLTATECHNFRGSSMLLFWQNEHSISFSVVN